ncbi:MAG: thiamine pyrophosphate-binding protein [Lachnospiraceae bacterium]|nr:thiamine pyrophosphate-binding protein [Lachnospiraceae bacterium]
MKIKVAKYIADFLVNKGVKHIFTVTGGGAMHLNDALGHKEGLTCIYNHHEQACSIAAEGYTRDTGKVAAVCVTSGPGGTNAITGVLGGWLDSIPMFILSGQVKRETTIWSTEVPLRQLGDQEFNIVDSVSAMTKYAVMITEPEKIRYHLEKAWFLCKNGRGGPVWLDIPLDVQAALVETEELIGYDPAENKLETPIYDKCVINTILDKICQSKRPVIFAGTGIRLADAHKEFMECIDALQIPVVTAWNAHDVLEDHHPLYCGRPGTVGTRGGNFVVQNSDLLLVLGSRLNIRLISYNYKDFAKDAYKIVIDIDENELKKPTVTPDLPVHADVKEVMKDLANQAKACQMDHSKWVSWCHEINQRYPATLPKYFEKNEPLNPYVFTTKLFRKLKEGDKVICGNGSACVITFQAAEIKKNQRLFTNSGCAAMGYGFPAALGVCVANPEQRVICIDGDGSFQMNMQELQTVVYHQMNLKLFLLNNNGYHSIRQTQTNLFEPPLVGVCDGNGISFPSFEKLAFAYEIPYQKITMLEGIEEKIEQVLESEGPMICEVVVDPNQNFEPKLSSKVLPDGKIVSPPIDDMFPFLQKEEYEKNKDMSQFL